MIVLVTGGRDYTNAAALFRTLDNIHAARPIILLVHGGCKTGADAIAHRWAWDNVVDVKVYEPRWERGPKAGPERNERMVSDANPNLAVVTSGGRGTADCRRRLVKHQVPIVEVCE